MTKELDYIVATCKEEWEEALTLAHECLGMLHQIYGKFHPNISHLMASICEIIITMNDGNKKYRIAFSKETLKALKVTHGSDHQFYRNVQEQLHEIL